MIWKKPDGEYLRVMHKRIGVDVTNFTLTQVDCKTLRFRVLGDSEKSAESIVPDSAPGQWVDLVGGSSKAILVHRVCGR